MQITQIVIGIGNQSTAAWPDMLVYRPRARLPPFLGILPRLLPQNEMHNNLQKKSISMLFGQAAELSYTA
jgi:hypothetical protein